MEPGFRLERYELLCKIGQGGMATVWVARTLNTHGEERLVAIKTIIPSLTQSDRLRTMLLDEARIAIAIEHPNVARTYEVGLLYEQPYLVLELIEGESVDTLVKALAEEGLTIPAPIVSRIVSDAALGLHAAHELKGDDGEELGIVHRDVAPPNILVDERGMARVIDFGVAKAAERFSPDTTQGVMKGRVPFMAPEHASGDAVDRRSDIWSLGVVAYVMLTGRFPFEAPNEAARLIRILGTDDPDPLPDSVPESLAEVVMCALSKDPDQRYATAEEFAAAMRSALTPATHAETAAFMQDTLEVTIDHRHALIENALAAADGRAHARELLDKPPAPGTTVSYRPPPASIRAPAPEIFEEEEELESPESEDDAHGMGTLGSVTRADRPPVSSWRPWLTAILIAAIVLIAFALGSFNARAPGDRDGAAASVSGPRPSVGASAQALAAAEARGRAEAEAEAARARAHAEAEAAEALARANALAAADAGAPSSSSSAKPMTLPPVATVPVWLPPPATSSSASKPPKPPVEPEDTIF